MGSSWRGVMALACTLALTGPGLSATAVERAEASSPAGSTTTGVLPARADDAEARFPLTDAAVRRALGQGQDDVTFSVRDRRTGATYTYNPDMRNETASVVKVLVLATVARERRESGRELTRNHKRLADLMIRHSDNDATSTLFNQVGSGAVARMAEDLGMTRTEVSWSWGKTTTSAADQRLLMDRLVDGSPHLHRDDRAYIVHLMARVTDEQRWGVSDVPATKGVSVKNGWLPLGSRGWRVNSIGSVKASGRDYTLAILSHRNDTMDEGVARTKTVSELVWKALTPPGATLGAAAQTTPGDPDPALPRWISRGAAFPPRPWG